MIEKEDFEAWMAHPVTEYILKRVGELSEANKQKWMDVSWGTGSCDPMVLVELKARSQAAKDLSELTFEDINDEPERNTSN